MKTLVEMMRVSEEKDLPTIYCDMDMVLCNFLKGAEEVIDAKFADVPKADRWEKIRAKKDFWHTLEWMPGSEGMWKFINRYDAIILSAFSSNDPNSRPGKLAWLKKNAKLSDRKRIELVKRADKQNYATTNGKPNILIDDYIKNIKEWEAKGGIGIHHTSASKTISELKKLGFR
jgi:hypothetical protein